MSNEESQSNCGSSPLLSDLRVQRGGVTWIDRLLWPSYYYVQHPVTQRYLHADGTWGWGTCFKNRKQAEKVIKIARYGIG